MIVVRNLSFFDVEYYFGSIRQAYNTMWDFDPSKLIQSKIDPYSFEPRVYTNNLFSIPGVITPDDISFKSGTKLLKILFNTSPDFIPYTKCFYINAIVGIRDTNSLNNILTYRGILRFVYDGPKELELIWRLSL